MRLTVSVGSVQLRVPCDGIQTVGWLQGEIIRRWKKMHLETIRILELRTANNSILDPGDQIFDVLGDDDIVVVVLKQSATERARTGDMLAHRYYLNRLVGEGAYGEVFAGKDLTLSRQVAVKVLKPNQSTRINTRRFLQEAEITARLSAHPNVVTVYDFGRTESGVYYLVMELLRGRALDELMEDRVANNMVITEKECIAIMVPVLDALEAAHSHQPPVVHRDLKPDNIFLSEVGENVVPTLMDFGIATLGQTTDQNAAGTRLYASPEQSSKRPVDGRSDVWSIGAILYQCVTLLVDLPFDPVAVDKGSVIPNVKLHAKTPISDEFAACITRALQRDPNARFESARSFRLALLAVDAKSGPSALSTAKSLLLPPSGKLPPAASTNATPRVDSTIAAMPKRTEHFFQPTPPDTSDRQSATAAAAPSVARPSAPQPPKSISATSTTELHSSDTEDPHRSTFSSYRPLKAESLITPVIAEPPESTSVVTVTPTSIFPLKPTPSPSPNPISQSQEPSEPFDDLFAPSSASSASKSLPADSCSRPVPSLRKRPAVDEDFPALFQSVASLDGAPPSVPSKPITSERIPLDDPMSLAAIRSSLSSPDLLPPPPTVEESPKELIPSLLGHSRFSTPTDISMEVAAVAEPVVRVFGQRRRLASERTLHAASSVDTPISNSQGSSKHVDGISPPEPALLVSKL